MVARRSLSHLEGRRRLRISVHRLAGCHSARGNPWTGLERKNRQNERADGQREAQGDYPQRDSGQHTRQRPTCRFVQQPAFERQNQVGKTLRGATRLEKNDET